MIERKKPKGKAERPKSKPELAPGSVAGSGETQTQAKVDKAETRVRTAAADVRIGVKNLVGKAKDNNARR